MSRPQVPADERTTPINVTLYRHEIRALEQLQAALGNVSRTQAVRVAIARALEAEGVQP